jgi:[ribosomal protein S18]-alanine N-acetyltransferase
MIVRRATPDDLLETAALDRTAWSGNPDSEFIPDGEHAWRIWIENSLVLVAEADNMIIGCALAFAGLDGTLCLHKIFVRGSHRGRGAGRQLLAELSRFCDAENRTVWLTVDPSKSAAIAIYTEDGYETIKRIDGFYRETEPRLILRRVSAEGV